VYQTLLILALAEKKSNEMVSRMGHGKYHQDQVVLPLVDN